MSDTNLVETPNANPELSLIEKVDPNVIVHDPPAQGEAKSHPSHPKNLPVKTHDEIVADVLNEELRKHAEKEEAAKLARKAHDDYTK